MSIAVGIAVLWIAFMVTHIWPTSASLRPRLVARLGAGPYLGLYSLLAFATFVPLCWLYFSHRHDGPLLYDLRDLPALRGIVLWVSGVSFAFSVAAFFQPSPVGMGPGANAPQARGLARITRHPLFLPIGILALAHLSYSGYLTDVVFFGGLALYSFAGCAHQDARKRALEGEQWSAFFAETSFVPFAALLSGRTRLSLRELPWIGFVIGGLAAWGFYRLHWKMFF